MDTKGPSAHALTSLTYIGTLADNVAATELAIAAHIEFARAQGASWRMIGVALGTSTQAAWERYRPAVAVPEDLAGQYLPFDGAPVEDQSELH